MSEQPSIPASRISAELGAFLHRTPVRQVYFAEGKNPPPPLAFLVRFPRLSLTLKGCDQMEVEIGGSNRLIEPRRGEVVFVPANCWNKPNWARPARVLHLLFGDKHLGISLVEHAGGSEESVYAYKAKTHRVANRPVQTLLNALVEFCPEREKSPVDRLIVEALLHSIQRLLEESPAVPGRKARATYDRACLYVQGNFHRPLTRESVAAELQMNPNHLSRLFRQEGLMRFTDYLSWVRLDRAKFLLKHHELQIDAIATACGYSDTGYFCRVFKQKTRLTPSQYRQTG